MGFGGWTGTGETEWDWAGLGWAGLGWAGLTGPSTPQYGFDHRGLKSLNIVLCSVNMLSSRMFGQQLYSIKCNTNESYITNLKTTCAHNTIKHKNHIQLNIQEKIRQKSFMGGGLPSPPSTSPLFPSQARRWWDELNDARLYPHGPYALGALYFMQNVTVYYINCIA